MQIKIRRNHWNALQIVAPKGEVRYYLCGVHLRPDVESPYAEATDGHRLLRVPIEVVDAAGHADIDWAMSFSFDGASKAIKKCGDEMTLDVLPSNGGPCRIEYRDHKGGHILEQIDGKFPDTDKVLSDLGNQGPMSAFGVNPAYLTDVALAIVDATLTNYDSLGVRIEASSPDAPLVVTGTVPAGAWEGVTYIVMPMRV